MSKSIKLFAIVGLFAALTACEKKEEVMMMEPEPISVEPMQTGKHSG
ncbi:MAG: hypothetical protein OXC62_04685 [Aestuariivita sp.]|nr:hypothetical protein [Aestuariivita sp.]